MSIPRHYTTREVAELLSVSEDTVQRYAQRGLIESVRIGNVRRFPEPAVQAFLDSATERAFRQRRGVVVELAGRREAKP